MNKYVLPFTIISFKIEVIFISVADSVHCGFTVIIALVIVMSGYMCQNMLLTLMGDMFMFFQCWHLLVVPFGDQENYFGLSQNQFTLVK